MKKALFKDSIRQIKYTYKRFISILLMAFLGVGFFAGIRAASPDMVDTIDTYYKNKNYIFIFIERKLLKSHFAYATFNRCAVLQNCLRFIG